MSCRTRLRKPETWTELVESGMDEYEVALALLAAAKEVIEDQEREITAYQIAKDNLELRLAKADSAIYEGEHYDPELDDDPDIQPAQVY